MDRIICAASVLCIVLVIGVGTIAAAEPVKGASESGQSIKTECPIDASVSHQAEPATAGKSVNPPVSAGHPKVVFQINQAADATAILRFVANYLKAEPAAKEVVVGYGGGVDFMLKGALDATGKPYAEQLQALADKGLAFKACNNTLKGRNLSTDAIAPGVTVVPGAVNETIRLQTREGYAYFRH